MLAFTPEFLFIGGSINNDNGAAFCGALALWGALAIYRDGGRVRAGWWTPLALGAGVLAKVSSLALWPVVGLAIALGVRLDRREPFWPFLRRVTVAGLLVFLPALLMIAPWFVRNWRLYGDGMGMNMALQTIDQRTAPWSWADTTWLLRGWFVSFWGKFGGAGHIPLPPWLYMALAIATVISVCGLVWLWLRGDWRSVRIPLLLLGLAVIAVVIGMWRYSLVALGTDQGRLLYPAASALVVLFSAGQLVWIPDRWQRAAALALVGLFAALALVGLFAALALVGLFAALAVMGLWGVLLPAF